MRKWFKFVERTIAILLFLYGVIIFPDRITPMPDNFLAKHAMSTESMTTLDSRQQALGGLSTPFTGTMTPGMVTPTGEYDLRKIGEARNTLMDVKLNQVKYSFCNTVQCRTFD